MHRPRVLILGVDGGTLDLIDPWAAAGHLPHLSALMAGGTSGRLISTLQPVTSTAWATFMTGVNAGKHGLYDFVRRLPDSYTLRVTSSIDIRARTLFEMAGDHGKRVLSINVPYTSPPRSVNGVMVAGPFAPSLDASQVYPPEAFDSVRRICPDYFILPDFRPEASDPLREFAGRLLEEIQQRERLALHFLRTEEWDLCAVVFMATDEAHHSFWGFMAAPPGSREAAYADVILTVYRELDRAIGQILAECEDNGDTQTSVVVMSDHGGGPLRALINLNHWLASQGLLTFRQSGLRHAHLDPARLVRAAASAYRRLLPAVARDRIRGWLGARAFNRIKGDLESALVTGIVDWPRTQVYSLGSGGNLCINLKGREPQGIVEPGVDFERLRERVHELLLGLRDPATGTPVVRQVHNKEDLYRGEHMADAPDLIIEWADYSYWGRGSYQPPSTPVFQEVSHFEMSAQPLSGTHRLEGFYILQSAATRPGVRGPDARLVDIAPTCLALLELPLPEYLDGLSLVRGTGEHARLSTNESPPTATQKDEDDQTGYTAEESEMIAHRLRDLGYL